MYESSGFPMRKVLSCWGGAPSVSGKPAIADDNGIAEGAGGRLDVRRVLGPADRAAAASIG